MAPANKEKVIDLWVNVNITSRRKWPWRRTISSMNHPGGFEVEEQLDLEGFKNVLKLRAEVEGQWGGHPPGPEKYYDPAYYNAARDGRSCRG